MNKTQVKRRFLLKVGALTPAFSIISQRGDAAQFQWKLATGREPGHPVNLRAAEAIKKIREETNGGLDIKLYISSQLGTDAQLIAQTRLGGIQMMCMAGSVLATTIPIAGIVNIGYAFLTSNKVWEAVDGPLGSYIASKIGEHNMHQIGVSWENGFRDITSSNKPVKHPSDLHNFKIRTPQAPILSSMFADFGAAPTSMDFSEVYTALENHVVDGQENPLPNIYNAKFYEVQKYLSITQHAWDSYLMIGNKLAFSNLSKKWQDIVVKNFSEAGLNERKDIAELRVSLRDKLAAKGMTILDVDKSEFRQALSKTDYYSRWKQKFGAEAWSMLEKTTGPLG